MGHGPDEEGIIPVPQFFVDPKSLTQESVVIRGKEARHLQEVLRLDVGDWVVLCDGQGKRYRAEITASKPLNVQLKRGEALPELKLPRHLTLAAALIRPQRFDWLVEKAFELGCRQLIPMTTERTVERYINEAHKHHMRWSEIAMSAAKQSGLPWIPEVAPLTPLMDVVSEPSGKLVYCWEGMAMPGVILSAAKDLKRDSSASPQNDTLTLLIGPEGGFAPAEHDQIMTHHPQLLSLGPLILRSETAALAAIVKVMQ